nr:hypothetical protein [Acidobacteriota bacterium]
MSKELIVSVNGREKKIAIIENERVTEFYIERGEENQGIVGNIYKGRVMRVLPGMQSAFVDVGLERDAFLYVSDFFDEEEEFERIVLDKSKKADTGAAERAAQEHIEQARIEREHHIDATQERLEPLHEAGPDADEAEPAESAFQAEPVETQVAGAATVTGKQAEETEESGRRRGRRGRRRGKTSEEQGEEATTTQRTAAAASALNTADVETPFAAGGSDFQRVVDEEEIAAAENGEMFKDARLQERIFDQIHAVEFDMEGVHETEVGSLLNSGLPSDASFQRVDDSDIAPASEGQQASSPRVQKAVAAHVTDFIDEVAEEARGAQSFERISDDERLAEGVGVEETSAAETLRGKRGATKKGRQAKTADPAAQTAKSSTGGEAASPKGPRSSAKKAATKSTTKRVAGSKKAATTTAAGGRKRRTSSSTGSEGDEGETDMAVLETESERAEHTDMVASEAADGAHFEAGSSAGDEGYEDTEASVKTGRLRAEFATRRGGRRRRRPGGKPQEGAGEESRANGKDEEAESPAEVEETPVVAVAATPAPAPRSQGRREARPERNGREDRR